MHFEPQLPDALAEYFNGSLQVKIGDPDGIKSKYVISLEDEWKIIVTLKLGGLLGRYMCLKWQVHAYVESIGKGPEGIILEDTFDMKGIGTIVRPYTISAHANFKDSSGDHIEKGIYKMVVAVNAFDFEGKSAPFAGHDVIPYLQFFPGQNLGD